MSSSKRWLFFTLSEITLFISVVMLCSILAYSEFDHSNERNGYLDVPRFLDRNVRLEQSKDTVFTFSGYAFDFSKTGFPLRIRSGNKLIVDSCSLQISEAQETGNIQMVPSTLESMRKSYFFQIASTSTGKTHDMRGVTLENSIETFINSPRIYCYVRVIGKGDLIVSLTVRFVLSKEFTTIVAQTSPEKKSSNYVSLPATMFMNGTGASLVCSSAQTHDGVAMFFSPSDPEVRKWYRDDYVVVQRPKRKLQLVNNADGSLAVEMSIDSVKVHNGETIDQNITVVNLLQGDDGIFDYIDPDVADYYGRYNPREGYSTHWYGKKNGFDDIHDNGFTWGFSTYARPFMEFYLHKNQDSLHGYFKEEMIRHFEYFLERSTTYGLLPYTILPKYLVEQTKAKERLYPDFLFAQAGVGDIDFASRFLPSLSTEEASRIYTQCSRLKLLYDPNDPMSWTLILPSGAYWFEYSNLWKAEGYINYIINTHVTALRIAVHMKELSTRLGKTEDTRFWEEVVRRGTDGLLWYIQNPKNWGRTLNGNRELNYKIGQPPHGEYHKDIVEDIGYLIRSGLMTYRTSEIREALSIH